MPQHEATAWPRDRKLQARPWGVGGTAPSGGWRQAGLQRVVPVPQKERELSTGPGGGELGHLPAGEPRQNPSDGRSSRPARCPVLQPRPLPLPTPRAQGKEALAGRGLPTASALPRAWERRPPLLPSPRGPRGWGGGGGMGGGLWESESLGSDVTLAASRTRRRFCASGNRVRAESRPLPPTLSPLPARGRPGPRCRPAD